MKKYLINFDLIRNIDGEKKCFKKEIIVHNQINSTMAVVNLGSYLRKKYGDSFICFTVNECHIYNSTLEELLNMFMR